MKKVVFLLLASFLVLAACGNKEESRLEDNKEETKTSEKENKEDKKEKDEDKESDDKEEKSDDKSNEEVATQDETTEQPVQSQEQVNTQEQRPVQSQEQAPVVEEQPTQQEPIDEEQWARENIEGGTDAHAAEEMEEFYQQERAKEQENSNSLSEQEIENEINQKANTPEGAEVIRSLGEQGIRTNPPGEAIGN
ncbi:hypothetical protein [Staphylococcus equorum]|uniref:hypothetical protein n=1 Tax=Staphylococcus equorum TaxID=246432 RepID=UPI00255574BA|nr:hypothetical protein [Staphylococcus equorum]MDK9870038.1 hypothetical protein [Staphylococcus equorum]